MQVVTNLYKLKLKNCILWLHQYALTGGKVEDFYASFLGKFVKGYFLVDVMNPVVVIEAHDGS